MVDITLKAFNLCIGWFFSQSRPRNFYSSSKSPSRRPILPLKTRFSNPTQLKMVKFFPRLLQLLLSRFGANQFTKKTKLGSGKAVTKVQNKKQVQEVYPLKTVAPAYLNTI